jgi:hypothetical protein
MQTLGVAGNDENPSGEDHNEGNIIGTCRIACSALTGLNKMPMALLRQDGEQETSLGIWIKQNKSATRSKRSC